MVDADSRDNRPLTAKGRATRDRIVQVAAELILSEGLSALNMDALRKTASVSGSQLAHYFTDKRALIRAIVARQINVVLDFHRQPKLAALDTFDDFERWIDLNMRYLRRIGYSGTPTYHALAGQLGKSDTATRETLAAGYWQWIELLEQAIQRMKDHRVLVAHADPRQVGFGHRQRTPRRRHAELHLSGGVAARRRGALCGQLLAHVRQRPHRTGAAPTAACPQPARSRAACLIRAERGGHVPDDATSRLTRKGRATRARIVDVAARLIFERGVAGTSIDEVRNSAAVSGSQISHYFHDKRDLTRQVIAARCNDVQKFHTQPPVRRPRHPRGAASMGGRQHRRCRRGLPTGWLHLRFPGRRADRSRSPKSTTISPPATTDGSSCFAPGSQRCAAAAICVPTPTRDTSRSRWSPRIRAARCSLMPPTTRNRCAQR